MRFSPAPILLLSSLALTGCWMEYNFHKTSEGAASESAGGDGAGEDGGGGGGGGALFCADICKEHAAGLPPDCQSVACGYNIGSNAQPPEVVADLFDAEVVGACQMIVTCEPASCNEEFLDCIEDSGSPLGCEEVWQDCETRNECAAAKIVCDEEALLDHLECTHDECDEVYAFDLETCRCEEEECLTGHELHCGWGEMLVSGPVEGPENEFQVTRKWVAAMMTRLDRLSVENRVWPVDQPNGPWRGVRIGDLDEKGPLANAGLADDDVIVKINGTPIATYLYDPPALLQLLSAPVIKVRLRRKGQFVVVRYHLVD